MRYHRLVKSFFDFNSQDLIVNSPFHISFKLVSRINIYINIKTFS